MEIALKTIALDFNPVQINLIRFGVGALVLLPFALKTLKQKGAQLGWNDFRFFALTGFIGITLSMTLYQLAIVSGHASIVAILFSCNPVFVVPFAFFILKEKVQPYTVISTVISLIGMFCIMNSFANGTGMSLASMLLSVASAIAFALYGVVGKTRAPRYGGVANTCFSFLLATAEMLVLVVIGWIPPIAQGLTSLHLDVFARIPLLHGFSFANLPVLLYVSIFVTGIGYASFFLAIEKTSATISSLIFYIKPALAPVLALVFLGESILGNTLIGMVFIVVGSAVAFWGNSRT